MLKIFEFISTDYLGVGTRKSPSLGSSSFMFRVYRRPLGVWGTFAASSPSGTSLVLDYCRGFLPRFLGVFASAGAVFSLACFRGLPFFLGDSVFVASLNSCFSCESFVSLHSSYIYKDTMRLFLFGCCT